MKEMLCEICHALADKAHEQIDNLDCINTKEMDKVIHSIKNLQEAIYYNTIVEAMKGDASNGKTNAITTDNNS